MHLERDELRRHDAARAALQAEAKRRSADPVAAGTLARDALTLFPADPGIELTLSEALLDASRPADALATVDDAIRNARATPQILDVGARAAQALEDTSQRLEMAERSYELSGRHPEAAIRLSEAFAATGRRAEARAVLIGTLSRDPSDIRLQRALIASSTPPRWLRVALMVLPFALAVIVAWLFSEALGNGPPEGGAPQPGVLGFIAGSSCRPLPFGPGSIVRQARMLRPCSKPSADST